MSTVPDLLALAEGWLYCERAENVECQGRKVVAREAYCVQHGSLGWPCEEAVRVAALIEARDREIRADECEKAAALVRARVTADNADIGPNGRALERRAIAKALRERAAQHRGDTND